MESGTRKKRTLAERRESDKLRQRRFRAKKREEARLLGVLTGEVEEEKKASPVSKKTAEEIRETNRIRQQRFRAKKRGDLTEEQVDTDATPVAADFELDNFVPTNPVELFQQIMMQAVNDEKDKKVEIRREKDRIRKRRERQRKKDRELKAAGLTPESYARQEFQNRLAKLEKQMSFARGTSSAIEEEGQAFSDEMEDIDDYEDTPERIIKREPESPQEEEEEGINNTDFMSQLEQMGLLIGLVPSSEHSPTLEIKRETESPLSEEPCSSSSPLLPTHAAEILMPERRKWERCNNSEERRERERMRKRMYRAKQKFISTGKLEMEWDPAPIKRSPNDNSESVVTPIPEWSKNLSSEQKLAVHRIYNKRYRERTRCSANATGEHEIKQEEPDEIDVDISSLPPEIYTEILTIISQCDLTTLITQNA